jgi:cysteine desulfurase/selenocysteine lyase
VTFDVDALRRAEFPWAAAGESTYLNNASTGPLPVRTQAALAAFNALRGAPHRLTDDIQFATLAKSRELIARLVCCATEEIALATNTTYGINLAAFGLPFQRGDVVLGVDQEFPANVYPWMEAARRRSFEFRLLPVSNGLPDEDALVAALDKPGVKAVALSWTEFATGYTFDLARVGAACRERGIWFVVDGIQGLGPRTLDLSRTPIDVFACGAQKWLLSPWGAGFVYVRRELIDLIAPHEVSWLAVKGSDDFTRLTDYDLTWRDDARRYEMITLPFQDFAGMNASLELFHEVGPDAIAAAVDRHADMIVAWAQTTPGIELVTPRDPVHRAGIMSVRPRDPLAASKALRTAGVVHSLREGAIRLAPHFYNTEAEVARALAILGEGEQEQGH